ncbi:MAG: class I SAM-dependent methyltransferase [Patescibacteria group bacterium]
MASQERFGYEWSRYKKILPEHEGQFLKWVFPLVPEDFKGKRVLDAGCGMGRNSFWPLKYGVSEAVAFDFDQRSVQAARRNLSAFPHARVLYQSVYDADFENEFDIVFSIGVIHHLENPREAVRRMVRAAKSGGAVLIWVYGYEGNEWIVKFVSPARRLITSRLPPAFLNFLTYFLSAPFFALVKILPFKNPYLRQLKNFGFNHIHSIIFDQLLPRVANYYKKEEAFGLMDGFGLKDIEIYRKNKNSWTVLGRKT